MAGSVRLHSCELARSVARTAAVVEHSAPSEQPAHPCTGAGSASCFRLRFCACCAWLLLLRAAAAHLLGCLCMLAQAPALPASPGCAGACLKTPRMAGKQCLWPLPAACTPAHSWYASALPFYITACLLAYVLCGCKMIYCALILTPCHSYLSGVCVLVLVHAACVAHVGQGLCFWVMSVCLSVCLSSRSEDCLSAVSCIPVGKCSSSCHKLHVSAQTLTRAGLSMPSAPSLAWCCSHQGLCDSAVQHTRPCLDFFLLAEAPDINKAHSFECGWVCVCDKSIRCSAFACGRDAAWCLLGAAGVLAPQGLVTWHQLGVVCLTGSPQCGAFP